jgi:hypothetical protein
MNGCSRVASILVKIFRIADKTLIDLKSKIVVTEDFFGDKGDVSFVDSPKIQFVEKESRDRSV